MRFIVLATVLAVLSGCNLFTELDDGEPFDVANLSDAADLGTPDLRLDASQPDLGTNRDANASSDVASDAPSDLAPDLGPDQSNNLPEFLSEAVLAYDFEEPEGAFVPELGGKVDYDLRLIGTAVVADGRAQISGGWLESLEPPVEFYEQATDSGEFTIAVWTHAATDELTLDGNPENSNYHGRVWTFSADTGFRNTTFGQWRDSAAVRFRTSTSPNGTPQHETESVFQTQLQHHVLRVSGMMVTYFVDGGVRDSWVLSEPISDWDSTYRLYLGNESTGTRPWVGDIYDLRVFVRALDDEEIARLADLQPN